MIRDRQRLRALHSVHRSLPKSILWSLHNDNSSSTNKNNSTKIWASVQETEFGVYSWCLVLSKGPILSLLKTAIQLSSHHLLKRSFSSDLIFQQYYLLCFHMYVDLFLGTLFNFTGSLSTYASVPLCLNYETLQCVLKSDWAIDLLDFFPFSVISWLFL